MLLLLLLLLFIIITFSTISELPQAKKTFFHKKCLICT